jgi:hypothetical protein
MDRRLLATLAVVGTLVLAGCTGLAPSGDATDPTTPVRATGTPTGSDYTPTPYPDTTTELPDGPMEVPDRPAELNRTSAASYVRTFEYRYAYNALWYGDASDVHVECETESVEAARDGYRVTVECYGYSNTGGSAAGTATATEIHADWGDRAFTYYVDGDTTRRLDGSRTASPA